MQRLMAQKAFREPPTVAGTDALTRDIKKRRASRPKVRTGCTTCKYGLLAPLVQPFLASKSLSRIEKSWIQL
jgi:hypothetical protein